MNISIENLKRKTKYELLLKDNLKLEAFAICDTLEEAVDRKNWGNTDNIIIKEIIVLE